LIEIKENEPYHLRSIWQTNIQPHSFKELKKYKELLNEIINRAYKTLSPNKWFIYNTNKYNFESFVLIHGEKVGLDPKLKRLHCPNRFCLYSHLLFYIYGTGFPKPQINAEELINGSKKIVILNTCPFQNII